MTGAIWHGLQVAMPPFIIIALTAAISHKLKRKLLLHDVNCIYVPKLNNVPGEQKPSTLIN